jgi:hypothetical protein
MAGSSKESVCRCALGVRAEPAAIHWAVVTGTPDQPVREASDTATAPNTFSEGEGLVWIREKVLYIIDKYRPMKVSIRYAERNARGANKDSAKARCRVEGVVLEAAASRNLATVTGALNTFGRHLGSASAKADLDADDLRGLDWSNYKDKDREAILVAVSLLSS